jgi:hypothetical protein
MFALLPITLRFWSIFLAAAHKKKRSNSATTANPLGTRQSLDDASSETNLRKHDSSASSAGTQ